MAKFIALMDWTDKGVKDAKASPNRHDTAHALAKELGGHLQHIYLTMGGHDLVAILDMPSDEAMATFALKTAAHGNVRTTTLRAFDEAEYRKIAGGL